MNDINVISINIYKLYMMYVWTNKDKLLACFTGAFQSVIVSSVAC